MVARSTLWLFVGSLALPLVCGSDDGSPPTRPEAQTRFLMHRVWRCMTSRISSHYNDYRSL
jgi:hypothetical protein